MPSRRHGLTDSVRGSTRPGVDGRMRARRQRQAILAQVEPMVQRLFAKPGDASKVVEKIKTEPSLSPRGRQVALQMTLRMSLDRQQAAAPTKFILFSSGLRM